MAFSLDLTKLIEVRKVGDRSIYYQIFSNPLVWDFDKRCYKLLHFLIWFIISNKWSGMMIGQFFPWKYAGFFFWWSILGGVRTAEEGEFILVDIYFSQVIPSTYCYYTIYTYLARQVTRAPAENVSSVSLSVFNDFSTIKWSWLLCSPQYELPLTMYYTINDNSNSLLTKTTPLSQSVQPTYCHLRIKLWIKCVRKVPDIKAIYAFMVRCVLFSNSHF